MSDNPLRWSIAQLTAAYQQKVVSPLEVTEAALARIAETDGQLNAYVRTTADLAREQAKTAERAYQTGAAGPLSGIPLSIKDAFHIKGQITTLGSLAHQDDVIDHDSGSVRRLRTAGAVFTGKTNVPEFCQSATTDNLLGPDTANPWDISRTPGGSSGGAAASVVAGTCLAALGSDGGGSIRIPAAFCGLVGLKPAPGRCQDENGYAGFSAFGSIGPLAWRVADARVVFSVLAEDFGERMSLPAGQRIAWCPQPEGRPVERGYLDTVAQAVEKLQHLGHHIQTTDLPLHHWKEAFGPLILAEEKTRRGHLLAEPDRLTDYQRRTLEGAMKLKDEQVSYAQQEHQAHRAAVDDLFKQYDFLATPATAVSAFPLRQRPTEIEGQRVSSLWGAFPFSAPFNVSGHPAIVLPAGLVDELPVALQLVGPMGSEYTLLNLAEELEEVLALDLFSNDLP